MKKRIGSKLILILILPLLFLASSLKGQSYYYVIEAKSGLTGQERVLFEYTFGYLDPGGTTSSILGFKLTSLGYKYGISDNFSYMTLSTTGLYTSNSDFQIVWLPTVQVRGKIGTTDIGRSAIISANENVTVSVSVPEYSGYGTHTIYVKGNQPGTGDIYHEFPAQTSGGTRTISYNNTYIHNNITKGQWFNVYAWISNTTRERHMSNRGHVERLRLMYKYDLNVLNSEEVAEDHFCSTEDTVKIQLEQFGIPGSAYSNYDLYVGNTKDIASMRLLRSNNNSSIVLIEATELRSMTGLDMSKPVYFAATETGNAKLISEYSASSYFHEVLEFSHEVTNTCHNQNSGAIVFRLPASDSNIYYDIQERDDPIRELRPNGSVSYLGKSGGAFVGAYRYYVNGNSLCAGKIEGINIIEYPLSTRPNMALEQNPNCQNGAQVSVTLPSGTSSYLKLGEMVYEPTGAVSSHTFDQVPGGNPSGYYVDSNGCNSDTETISVPSYANPSISVDEANVVDPSCYGYDNGSIPVILNSGGLSSNGTTQWRYSIDEGALQASSSFTGLRAKNYAIKVQDLDYPACSATINYELTEPDSIWTTISGESDYAGFNIKCHGEPNGHLSLQGWGGSNYTYHVQHVDDASPTSQSSNYFGALRGGDYQVWVSAGGCNSKKRDKKLREPSVIDIGTPQIAGETCPGSLDASIDLNNMSGGSGGYNFSWASGASSQKNENLSHGNYSVTVTDSSGCSANSVIGIQETAAITATFTEHEPNCPGAATGSIDLTGIQNGNATYSYSVNGVDFFDYTEAIRIENLLPGSGSLHIRDSAYQSSGPFSNCIVSLPFTIDDKQAVALNTANPIPPNCHGESNGSIQLTGITGPGVVANYTYQWYDAVNTPLVTTRDISNIPAGDYSVKIFDEQGCDHDAFPVTLTQPLPLDMGTITPTQASCSEVSDGQAVLSGYGGGTAGYSFSSNGVDFTPSPTLAGLSEGNHTLYMRDANLCETNALVTIGAGELLLTVSSSQDLTCFNVPTGQISLSASGIASPDYRYSINGGAQFEGFSTFSNLAAGTYTTIINDNNTSCQSLAQDVTLSEPAALDLLVSLNHEDACGQNLGEIGYQASGGSGSYYLELSSSSGVQTATLANSQFPSLATNNYTLRLYDDLDRNCFTDALQNVPDLPSPVIDEIVEVDQAWCNLPLGSARVTASSGTAPLQYLWDDALAQTTTLASSLVAGNYQVWVTDAMGCEAVANISLIDGPAITVSSTAVDATCNQNNGSAELTAAGGVAPYEYKWPDAITADYITSNTMSDLEAGNYAVSIRDDVGCIHEINVPIGNENGPELSYMRLTKSWCGQAHGTAHALATAPPDQLPVSMAWFESGNATPLSSADEIIGLASGNYSLELTDATGCVQIESFSISDSTELQPTMNFVGMDSASCGQALGSLEVEMRGGLAPYSYVWESPISSTQARANNVAQGSYWAWSTDNRGCKDSLQLAVVDKRQPLLQLVDIQAAYCEKPTGQIQVQAFHGTAPYTAYVDGMAGVSTSYDNALGAHTASIQGLMPIPYQIRLEDALGCEANLLNAVVGNESPMDIQITELQGVSCFGGSDGIMEVSVANGVGNYVFNWSSSTGDLARNENLPAGLVTVTAMDEEDCQVSISETIIQPAQLALDSYYTESPLCHGGCDGSITALGVGGSGVLSYIWNGTAGVATASDLCAGQHTLLLTDANSCEENFDIEIAETPPISDTDLPEEAEVCTGSEFLLRPGDEWRNPQWTSTTGFESNDLNVGVSEEGTYYFTAESENGCLVEDEFKLILSDNLLAAEFLMMSEAEVDEAIVLIEVSWPVPEETSWTLPEAANVLVDDGFYKEISFSDAGNYYVELTASLGGCLSVQGKYIDIYDLAQEEEVMEEERAVQLIISAKTTPNPAREVFFVEVELSAMADVEAVLVDLQGNVINNAIRGYGQKEYRIPVDIQPLRAGAYVLRIVAGNEVITKMIIVR